MNTCVPMAFASSIALTSFECSANAKKSMFFSSGQMFLVSCPVSFSIAALMRRNSSGSSSFGYISTICSNFSSFMASPFGQRLCESFHCIRQRLAARFALLSQQFERGVNGKDVDVCHGTHSYFFARFGTGKYRKESFRQFPVGGIHG